MTPDGVICKSSIYIYLYDHPVDDKEDWKRKDFNLRTMRDFNVWHTQSHRSSNASNGRHVSVSDLPDLQYYGYVDDFYATLEWSAGGIIHTHMCVSYVKITHCVQIQILSFPILLIIHRMVV